MKVFSLVSLLLILFSVVSVYADNCATCLFAVGAAERGISAEESDIALFVEKACNFLPASLASTCDSIVENYLPQIINKLLAKETPQVICQDLHFCPSSEAPSASVATPIVIPQQPTASASGLGCTICEFLMAYVENNLQSNATTAEIENFVDNTLCSIVPKSFTSTCDSFVSAYGPILIAKLVAQESPSVICTQIGLCTSSFALLQPQEPESLLCPLCTFVLSYLDGLISENSTESEIIAAVEKVCNIVPSSFQASCNSLVELYGPQIIQLLVNKIAPTQVCTELKLCSSEIFFSFAPEGPIECSLCGMIMSWIEGQIGNNYTEASITQAVESVCNYLPNSFVPLCKSFISQYGSQIISLILQYQNPSTVCQELGICSSVSVSAPVVQAVDGSIECVACTYVIGFLEGRLSQNQTEKDVETLLDDICNVIPGGYKSICQNLINNYYPVIVSYLLTHDSAAQLCDYLRVCNNAQVQAPVVVETERSGALCGVCQLVMNTVESYIGSNTTEQRIIEAVDQVCNILPQSFKATCNAFIDLYGPQIIQLLLNKESPSTICTQLGLCSSSAPKKSFIGVIQNVIACPVCELIVEYAEAKLSGNSTVQEVEKVLDSVCSVLPKSFTNTCESLVQDYSSALIQALLNKESPSVACTQIHLCSSSQGKGKTVENIPMN